MAIQLTRSEVERFWSKVNKPSQAGCWTWTADLNGKGYGRLRIYRGGAQQWLLAHRLSYELTNGRTLTPGLVVRHSCDNPPCCNPAHLSIGTQADNMADMRARGRYSPPPVLVGAAHPHAKLNDDEVHEIRIWLASGFPQRDIAAAYGVSQRIVCKINRGSHWSAAARAVAA